MSIIENPINISWHNINVSLKPYFNVVSLKKSPAKRILNNISGIAKEGKLLAIMGPSGCGKSTLLNVLTGRNLRNLRVSGTVLLNGEYATLQQITAISAYVQQADLFISSLTVREHLIFQAKLRMDESYDNEERISRVEKIMNQLGLQKCSNSKIGTPGSEKAISGGELKRLAFATEILTDPKLLFCDEPTSGLDSYMAESVITVMKKMTATRRTLICAIHQPSSAVFNLFDEILLLTEGNLAFIGNTAECLYFFSSLNLHCPLNYNPADFFISHLVVVSGKEDECRQKISFICEQFLTLYNGMQTQPLFADESFAKYKELKQNSLYKRSPLDQGCILLFRCVLCYWREFTISSVKTLQTILVSLILGIIYFDQQYDQRGIMNINGALFMILINNSFIYAIAVINTFSFEMPVFFREHNNGLYHVYVYFLSKTMAEFPFFVILPTLSISIVYKMINLNPNTDRFIICCLTIILIANVSTSVGYFISCLSNTIATALALIAPILVLAILFGGLLINHKSIPYYLNWMKYLSWIYYGNEILITNQWYGVTNITCTYNHHDDKFLCIKGGDMVIEDLSFHKDNVNFDVIMLILLFLTFRIAAFIFLYMRAKSYR